VRDVEAREVWAVRELLDHQLVDRADTPCGKIDDLAFRVDDEELPVLESILTGHAALAMRFNPKLGRGFEYLRRVIDPRGGPGTISWSRVSDIAVQVRLALDVAETPTAAIERWLSRHVLSHIPGAGIEKGAADAETQ
jgi:hypothetical protein